MIVSCHIGNCLQLYENVSILDIIFHLYCDLIQVAVLIKLY